MTKVTDSSQASAFTGKDAASEAEKTALFEQALGKMSSTTQPEAMVQALTSRLHSEARRPVAVYSLRMVMTRDEIQATGDVDSQEEKVIKSTMSTLLEQHKGNTEGVAVIDVHGVPPTFEVERIDDLIFVEGKYFDRTSKKVAAI